MSFESMSNLAAQHEYDEAIRELASHTHLFSGPGWDKAITALMKLYPQWKQFEWEQCLKEDLKEMRGQG